MNKIFYIYEYITVLPFKDAPEKPGSGTVVADAITNYLVKIDNWAMVERSQLSNIM